MQLSSDSWMVTRILLRPAGSSYPTFLPAVSCLVALFSILQLTYTHKNAGQTIAASLLPEENDFS